MSDGHRGNSEKPSETGKTNLKNENMLKKNLKRLRANRKKLAAQVEWRAFLVRRSRRWPGLRDPRHHYQMVTFPMIIYDGTGNDDKYSQMMMTRQFYTLAIINQLSSTIGFNLG